MLLNDWILSLLEFLHFVHPLDDVDCDSDAHDLQGGGACKNGDPGDFVVGEPVKQLGPASLVFHGGPGGGQSQVASAEDAAVALAGVRLVARLVDGVVVVLEVDATIPTAAVQLNTQKMFKTIVIIFILFS